MNNMHRLTLSFCAVTITALVWSTPFAAQTREGVLGELMKDVADVEKKIMDLAKAMPDSAYSWSPGPGVRSAAEVFQHIAADNYFIPALMDKSAPKETGITKDYKTAVAFEKKPMDKAAVIAELEKSFTFLRTSMSSTPDAQLNATIDLFGQKSTTRGLWITATTHLHEHLGQLIAYARANKVTPPWSK
jgi:uncharacterized damage-inducible protein DinB